MVAELIKQLPLIVIVGPTASGKTALAVELARRFHGEIICADSRTIYKGTSIGTAKPSPELQAQVPHWGLDLIEPGHYFSAADYKNYAVQKIEEIRNRFHVPFLVGGTGLYVDAVLFNYSFGPKFERTLRKQLEAHTIEELHYYCEHNNISLPENRCNKRYVIRAIERHGTIVRRNSRPLPQTIIVGITTEKTILRQRIRDRAEQIFNQSVVNEAINIGSRYGWVNQAMTGNVYPLIYQYITGQITFSQAKDKFTTDDWQLAKRQLTWFKRNPYIVWLNSEQAASYICDKLASE